MLTRSEDDTAKKVDSASVATACSAHDASLRQTMSVHLSRQCRVRVLAPATLSPAIRLML